MPVKFDEYSATICKHYITAIEYYDISGLTGSEIKNINEFLDQWPNACFEYSEESDFCRDDITGLMADCIEVKIFIPKKENLKLIK
jgi:hypothetical protein